MRLADEQRFARRTTGASVRRGCVLGQCPPRIGLYERGRMAKQCRVTKPKGMVSTELLLRAACLAAYRRAGDIVRPEKRPWGGLITVPFKVNGMENQPRIRERLARKEDREV